jgi:glutathione peroxidase
MKKLFLGIIAFIAACAGKSVKNKLEKADSIFDFTMNDIKGKPVSLKKYEGKVIVIVNVASKCGLTPQYKEIQAFYDKYKSKGVVVLGFPANNFLFQEPGTNKDIEQFCSLNYGVTFDMFSKIDVKGSNIHPLYQYLTQKSINGKIDAEVSWNFQKFLVGKDGKIVASFSPRTKVTEAEFISAVDALL